MGHKTELRLLIDVARYKEGIDRKNVTIIVSIKGSSNPTGKSTKAVRRSGTPLRTNKESYCLPDSESWIQRKQNETQKSGRNDSIERCETKRKYGGESRVISGNISSYVWWIREIWRLRVQVGMQYLTM